MSPERRIKRAELRKIFVETDYGIDQMIAAGTLDKPIRDTPTSHPYWTVSMVNAASQRLLAKSAKQTPPPVTLSRKHRDRARANA